MITPDASILGLVGVDVNVIVEGFRHAVGTLLTAMVDPGLLISGSRRIHPLLLAVIPLTALILTTRWQLHRTEGAPTVARLGWAMVVGFPFGLLMLAFAIIGGESDSTNISPSAGSAFALGLVWGALGGFIGAITKLPLDELTARVPPTLRTVGTVTVATLRPLAVVLVTCTAVALVGWMVQVGADAGGVRTDRSAATALIEEASFAAEHGIHLTALAAGARFRADANGPLGLPFPVEDANDVPGRRRRVPHLQLRRRAAGVRAAARARDADGTGGARRALRGLRRRPHRGRPLALERRRLGRADRPGVGDLDGVPRDPRGRPVPRRRGRRVRVRRLPVRGRAARRGRGWALAVSGQSPPPDGV